MPKYDYLIVGAGLFGSTFAWKMSQAKKKCLVIDKRDHIGGNCYTEKQNNIIVHKYGPHIFHTSNLLVWEHVNQFADFNNFTYRPKVSYKGGLYSFPINLMTFNQIYGAQTPEQAQKVLDRVRIKIEKPANLEEWCLNQVGPLFYEAFIYGYTKKQWGRSPRELPASIIKRIPIRLTYNDNYFNDIYQGIPIGGYTPMFEKMLRKVEVRTNTDYFQDRLALNNVAKKVVYTGMIDEFYDYQLGELEYRGLKFHEEWMSMPDYQGNAAINYTHADVPYTRIIEHAHFDPVQPPLQTLITFEYPTAYQRGDIPYYPVGDEKNTKVYNAYKGLAVQEKKFLFGGRLASYQYWDMHQTIPAALTLAQKELK